MSGKRCSSGQRCNGDWDCIDGFGCQNGLCAVVVVPEQPAPIEPWWTVVLAFIMPFWWLLLLGLLLIILSAAAYRYYETRHIVEELPPPPMPMEQPAPVPEMVIPVPEEVAAPAEEELVIPSFPEGPPTPAEPIIVPPPLAVHEEKPVRVRHYREITLPLYVRKEHYKRIQEYLPLLSSGLLKQNSEIYQDMIDFFHHKSQDHRRMRDAAEEVYKRLIFMDNFLFERGKKQHRVKFEE